MYRIPSSSQPIRAHPVTVRNYSYTANDFLGAGNFSKVYAATNLNTNQKVALKIVDLYSLDTDKLKQLHRSQIDVLSRVNHPNIIKCYQVFNVDTKCYIVTQLCPQGDLQHNIKNRGVFTQRGAQKYIRDVFEGIYYMAQNHIVHRDIKTANVFLKDGRAKIADFGFAVYASAVFSDLNIGSAFYMAPEGFINCVYSCKTDIWAYGILVYQLLHGNSPYSFCKLQTDLSYHLSLPFNRSKVNPGLSQQLKEVIYRCLEVNPQKRIGHRQLRELKYFRNIYQSQGPTPMYKKVQNRVVEPQELPRHQAIVPVPAQTPVIRLNHQQYIPQSLIPQSIKHSQSTQSRTTDHSQKISTYPFQPNTNDPLLRVSYQSKNTDYQPQNQRRNDHSRNHFAPLPQPRSHQMLQVKKTNIQINRHHSNQKLISANLSSPMTNNRQRKNSINQGLDRRRQQQQYIFINPQITYKVAVNILHYCRGLFRCVTLMVEMAKQQSDLKYLTGWLILVLQQLNSKLNHGGIVFQGSNIQQQAKRFRQVRQGYQRKYTNQLKKYVSNFIKKPNLQDIKIFLFMLFRSIDPLIISPNNTQTSTKSNSILQLGYLIILLYDSTRILQKCQKERSFSRFSNYKQIQNSLAWDKKKFQTGLYLALKKQMIIQN